MPSIADSGQGARLHAATLLAVWLMWLLAGQSGAAGHDAWMVACLLGAGFLALPRFLRLLRRLRWLLLAILITFAFGTPGRLVVSDFPLGPSFEGCAAALRAMTNLAAMAACVAVLLESLSPARLTGAMHRLLHPQSASSPVADSFALRLQLVLRDLERPLPAGQWMSWLEDRTDATPLDVEHCAPLTRTDIVVIGAAAAALAAWLYV